VAERSKPADTTDTADEDDKSLFEELDSDGDGLGLDDLVNRLDSFQLLRNSSGSDADDVLAELGATSEVDREIVLQLGAKRPLGHPERFEEAHGLAVRALEVLDRNGHRSIPVPNLSFLSHVVRFLVQIVTQFIVRSYISNVIDSMYRLYERREAASPAAWEHLPMLTRARIHTARIRPGFKRSKLALPAFLFGGAILSPLIGVLQSAIGSLKNQTVRIVLLVVLFLLLTAVSWIIVHGSAVARRRIRLTAQNPVEALYQVIGRCGHPPNNMSTVFAVISLILTIVSLVVDTVNEEARRSSGPLWVALGDSSSQGVGATAWENGWTLEVLRRLRETTSEPWRLINLSMSGGRFLDVADRQVPVLNTMLDEPALITCVIGSNDLMWRRGIKGVNEDADRTIDRLPEGTFVSQLNGPGPRPKMLNNIFQRGADTKGHQLFNIWNWPSGRGALAADRVHPSDIGYGHMAELAWNALAPGLGS